MYRAPIRSAARAAAALLLVSGTSAARADVQFSTVMEIGQAAPGYGPGATITQMNVGDINAQGDVPFQATVTGPGLHPDGETAIYNWVNARDGGGTLGLVVRTGDAAPQLGAGATFGNVFVNGSPLPRGQGVAYYGATAGTETQAEWADYSLWTAHPASAGPGQPFVRTGQDVPGVPGATIGGGFFSHQFKPGGHLSVEATLVGTGFDPARDRVILGGPAGSPALLARTNAPAPGMGPDIKLIHFSHYSYHSTGHTLFAGQYEHDTPGMASGPALWHRDPAGNVSIVARGGDPAAGLPDGFRYAGDFIGSQLNDGNFTFRSALYAPGQSESTAHGVWMGATPATAQPVLYTGQPAPGVPGQELRHVNQFGRLADGRFVVDGLINAPGNSNNTNVGALWQGPLDDLQLVLRNGDAAPGMPGVTIDGFNAQYDDAGHLLVQAALAGDGVTDANNHALWLYDPAGTAHLIARMGDTVVLDGVTWSFGMPFGGLAPGDSGLVLTTLVHADNPTPDQFRVVVVAVPEPAAASALALAGAAALLARRGRGARPARA